MKNTAIKKVIVELENGNTIEFDKQIVLYAEDEMSDTEKKLHQGRDIKMCGMVGCNPNFLANATECMLGSLSKAAPGLDGVVIGKHLEQESGLIRMLVDSCES